VVGVEFASKPSDHLLANSAKERKSMGRPRQLQVCCYPKCRQEIQPHEKGIAVTLWAETLGMGVRKKSKSERFYLCPQCAFRVASESMPSKSEPVELAYFKIMLDLAGFDPSVAAATFEQLQQRRHNILYMPAPPKQQVLPPEKQLKEGGGS
jgi:hypothetical protein